MAVSRRAVLLAGVAAGGGLALWYGGRQLDDGDAATKFAANGKPWSPFNAWLKISPEGDVVCAVHRAEMGQGVTTALPMLLAEELDADWNRVSFEFAPVDRDYFNFGILLRGQPLGDPDRNFLTATGHSLIRRAFHAMGMSMTISSASVIDAWDSLRPAGAAARAMLIRAAAERWGVNPAGLTAERGEVIERASERRLGYGDVAEAAALLQPPSEPALKLPAAYRLIGTSPQRLDLPTKVDGSAVFGSDVIRPNMLYAAISLGPVAGGTMDGFNTNTAEMIDGVHSITQVGANAAAVLARDSWTALRAADKISFNVSSTSPGANTQELFSGYRDSLDKDERSVFVETVEPFPQTDSINAEYELPYLAHVCLEPMNCTALVENGRVTVWAPTQALSIAADVAARVADVESSEVTIHRTLMGGGFGRRAEMDFVEYAVAAALSVEGRPVKLIYSRTQDVRHDMYRPAGLARVSAGTDQAGNVTAIDYELATQSVTASYYERTPTPRGGDAENDGSVASGASNLIYSVPNLRVSYVAQNPGVPVGYWRSTGTSSNGFVVESFIDELAAAAKRDPLAYRLDHLSDKPKHRAVLVAAAKLSNWNEPPGPNRGRGVALIENSGSICAQVVEVYISPRWELKIERVFCVFDCNQLIHPDTVTAQLEGSIVDGLSAALYGEITLVDGAVAQSNFDTYRVLSLSDTPQIDIELLPQGGRPGGVGEPAVPASAPALANAIFAATGRRIRKLPISKSLGAA